MSDDNKSQPPKILITEKRTLTEGIRNRHQEAKVSKKWFWILIVVAVLIVGTFIFMFVRTQQQLKSTKQELQAVQTDPDAKAKEEQQQLISEVGKLIILPGDEEPTIATVSDLSKLKGQAFFDKAKIGDKVLIYNKAEKAILYRPGDKKIIELAPLSNGAVSNTPSTPAPATPAQ